MTTFLHQVADPMGVHARPAGLLVKFIKELPASVTLVTDRGKAEGDKLLAIMKLNIRHGETVTFQLEGPDAQQHASALQQFCREYL